MEIIGLGFHPGNICLGEKKLILQLLLKLLIALNELFYQTVMYIKGLKLKIVFLIQICLFKGG